MQSHSFFLPQRHRVHREKRHNAAEQGKEFRLCIYYPTKSTSKEKDILIGKEFWSFVGGDKNTESEVFNLIRNTAKDFSFKVLIEEHTELLLKEYIKVMKNKKDSQL